MSDFKVCPKCDQVFYNMGEYVSHRNAHISGKINVHRPLLKRPDNILSVSKDQDIKSVKIEDSIEEMVRPPAQLNFNQPMQNLNQPMQNPPLLPPQQMVGTNFSPQQATFIPGTYNLAIPIARPITLKYVYDGTCPQCQSNVMTIETDVAKQHYVLAICPNCQQQWQSRLVVDLNKPEKEVTYASNSQESEGGLFRKHSGRPKGSKNKQSKSHETKETA